MLGLAGETKLRRIQGGSLRALGLVCVALSAQIASSQAIELEVVKKQRLAPPVAYNTATAWPQIQPPPVPKPKRISENPYTPPHKYTGTPNNLPVGGTTQIPNARPKLRFGGPDFTGYFPPDCDMGAGPNHVVAVVNTTLAFFTKTGTKQFQQDYATFFAGLNITGEVISDPKVFYDPVSKRWFTTIIEVGFSSDVSRMLVGVSDDDNPNGTWSQYAINAVVDQGGTKYWLDYPGFGCNKDGVVITGNMFGFENGYAGNQYIVIPKAPLLSGGQPTVTSFVDGSASTMKVAVTPDATVDKIYCIGDRNNSSIQVSAITGAGTTTPKVTTMNLTVPSFSYVNSFVFQTPNGNGIDAFDGRIFNAAYRNGLLVGAHAVQSPSSASAVCRWYQVRTNGWPTSASNPTLAMSGNVAGPSGVDFHMPAVNINNRGGMSLVFTRSSQGIQADMMVAARKPSDPAGFMGTPQVIAQSAGNNYVYYRWGDYFGLASDPLDDNRFWGFAMTVSANNFWTTWIADWKIVDIDAATIFTAGTPVILQGTYVRGNAASLVTVDANSYDVKATPVAGMGQVVTWESNFTTNLTPANVDYMAVKWTATGPAAATQFVFAYNWAAGTYDVVATKPIKSGTTETYEFAGAYQKYIRSDGAVRMAVRCLVPVRNGIMPSPYTFKVDMLQLLGLRKS